MLERCGDTTRQTQPVLALSRGAHVRCLGKERKVRRTLLRADTETVLRGWLRERQGKPADPVFPTARGTALSHTYQPASPSLPTHRSPPGVPEEPLIMPSHMRPLPRDSPRISLV